jgi:hypothetical protein
VVFIGEPGSLKWGERVDHIGLQSALNWSGKSPLQLDPLD